MEGLAKSLEAAGDLDTAQRCHSKVRELESGAQTPQEFETPPPPPTSTPPLVAPEPPAMEPTTEPMMMDEPLQETTQANSLLLTPIEPTSKPVEQEVNVEVDLAKAALDATAMVQANPIISANSSSVANQDISWYNQGIQLMEDGKYRKISFFRPSTAIICER